MNLVIDTEKCKADNITIFKNSKHKTRIGYKDNRLLLNGLYLSLNIKDLCIIYINHSYKCTFGYNKNKELLGKLIKLEKDILSKCAMEPTKKPVYNICRQVVEYPGTISLSHVKRGLYKGVLVKIIGIWESETEYGLIHYFYPITRETYAPMATTSTSPSPSYLSNCIGAGVGVGGGGGASFTRHLPLLCT